MHHMQKNPPVYQGVKENYRFSVILPIFQQSDNILTIEMSSILYQLKVPGMSQLIPGVS